MLSALKPIRGTNSKPVVQQLWEKVNWGSRLVTSPVDYVIYRLYERGKSEKDALKYLSGPRASEIHQKLNRDKSFFQDKLSFDSRFRPLGLSVASVVAVYGYPKLECNYRNLNGKEESLQFFQEMRLIKQQIVIKDATGGGGASVYVVSGWETKDGVDYAIFSNGEFCPIDDLAEVLITSDSKWIIQERVSQHETLDAINPSSLNTIRVGVYLRDDGEIEIPFAILRVGTFASQIDSFTQGGLAIRICPETGELSELAARRPEFSRELIARHPDSDFLFSGVKIPYWKEILEELKEFARNSGDNRFIGWDVAVSPDGPVIIEGNHAWGAHIAQVNSTGILTDSFVKILSDEVGIIIDNKKLPPVNIKKALKSFIS